MTAKIVTFPLKQPGPFRFTFKVTMPDGTRISGKSDHEYKSDLVEELLTQYPEATFVSIIKEIA